MIKFVHYKCIILSLLYAASLPAEKVEFLSGFPSEDLHLVGDATLLTGKVRLTEPNGNHDQVSAVWFKQKFFLHDYWVAEFDFQVTNPAPQEPDHKGGFAFVMQNNSSTEIGVKGNNGGYRGIGYQGISDSIALVFSKDVGQTAHVGVNAGGGEPWLGSWWGRRLPISMFNGEKHNVLIRYSERLEWWKKCLLIVVTNTVTGESHAWKNYSFKVWGVDTQDYFYSTSLVADIIPAEDTFVGFVGSSGDGQTLNQEISNFKMETHTIPADESVKIYGTSFKINWTPDTKGGEYVIAYGKTSRGYHDWSVDQKPYNGIYNSPKWHDNIVYGINPEDGEYTITGLDLNQDYYYAMIRRFSQLNEYGEIYRWETTLLSPEWRFRTQALKAPSFYRLFEQQ